MTRIMAALNVSPESFFSGSVVINIAEAVRKAEADGADMIDIGAMSTAPYKHARIDTEEEMRRMAAAVAAARNVTKLPVSADTQRALVAKAALEAGATHINDVSAFAGDAAMAEVCAASGAGVILMANDDPSLDEAGDSPVQVVARLLERALVRASSAGIARERIVLDPGIGFFRHRTIPWHEWDVEVLRNIESLKQFSLPLLVGASRKSMFSEMLGRTKPEDRLAGSLAVAMHCAMKRVEWLRVHDVAETVDVVKMAEALRT